MSLTGGTGDVNPQWFKMYQVASTTQNNTASTRVSIPVQRLASKKKAMVMEILKVNFLVRNGDGETEHCHVGISTIAPPTTAKPDNSMGYIIAAMHISPADAIKEGVRTLDLSDGAGHGSLVATDFVYPFVCSTKAASTAAFDMWILYRWKAVDLEEYSGMLQAQSN